MSTEDKVLRLENALSTLVELARTHSERMDEYERRTEESAQAQKQLTDVQRRLTEEQTRLTESQRRLMEGQIQLTEGQKQTEVNMSALITIVADLGRAQLRTEQTLVTLIERFDQYISGS
jgi:hypothetical protein